MCEIYFMVFHDEAMMLYNLRDRDKQEGGWEVVEMVVEAGGGGGDGGEGGRGE